MSNHREIEIYDLWIPLYYAERCLQSLRDRYFSADADMFREDEKAQVNFADHYGEIEAQLYAISELLFNARLKAEFAEGVNSNIVKAHIENEKAMLDQFYSYSTNKPGGQNHE